MLIFDSPTDGNLITTLQYFDQNLEPTLSPDNTLEFIDVQPVTANTGELTQFTATISYGVSQDATFLIGMNQEFRDGFRALGDLALVAGETGQTSFTIEGTPYDWGEGSYFIIWAILADPISGRGIASIKQIIQLN